MSFFKPKLQVTPEMLSMRLSDLLYRLSRQVDNSLEGINRAGAGGSIYEAMKHNTDALVAFAMQWAIKTSLKPVESQSVLEDLFFPVNESEVNHYWERFNDMPSDGGVWQQSGREYLMAGLAFQESCGSIEDGDVKNLIRQFGAKTFSDVFNLTRQELTSVRLRD